MKILPLVLSLAVLAGCSGTAKSADSQPSSSDTSAPAATAATAATADGADASASQALDGVKGRIPMYDSNITRKPQEGVTGMYQFETSDPPAQVAAWYKAHVPASFGGTWADPVPDAVPEWDYYAKLSDGAVGVKIQPTVSSMQKAYAAGTKAVVAVVDR